jgi:uncharacterized protein YegL
MEYCNIKLHIETPGEPTTPESIIHSLDHGKCENKFAILQMKMKNMEIIDFSGSMDDLCKDGNSKLYHVLNTIINIIKYCAQYTVNVSIIIDGFTAEVKHIVPLTQISKENVQYLINKVQTIESEGSTNIEIALYNSSNTITDQIKTEKFIDIHHIFLTDGEANMGTQNPFQLSQIIHTTKCTNTFIGFGQQHNTTMLQTFSTNVGCDYRFVNNGENAGMVYGEIMHTILRPALKNVSIEVQNGTIYDWRTNTWTSLCYESSIDSEVLKTYNIKCESGSQLRVTVRGITFENDKYEEIVQEVNCEETNTEPLYKYMFRQHTLELLSQCRTSSSISRIAQKACKKELKEFFKKMRQFMRRQNLTTDPFMYLLCEDIITAYKTIGTDLGNMYCTSRQSSQGRESSYSERYDQDTQVHPYATPLRNNKKNIGNIPPPPKLRRQINNNFDNIEIKNTNKSIKEASTFITEIVDDLIDDLIYRKLLWKNMKLLLIDFYVNC